MLSSFVTKPLSDQELIAFYLQTNDQRYFTSLYNRHRQRVYQICLTYMGNSDDADDFVQEIFMRLMDRLATFRGKSLFGTWLRSVAANYCLDQLRRRKREQVLWVRYRLEFSVTGTHWTTVFDEPNNQPAYERLFNQLPTGQRDLLYSKYGIGTSINDIAFRQGLTPSAVKMRLKRAKEHANSLYKQLQVEDDSM
ncbi:RNA polymerase sigma factor [uncultured Fibrella sp.]|uniref:RNA polymerase sigma factor n=1 Tax=uncultured Fibrella sp. TaxID=1284596 RepID=UPI0035CAA3DE